MKHNWAATELQFAMECLNRGVEVYQPLLPATKGYDFLVVSDGKPHRVQVKHTMKPGKDGRFSVKFNTANREESDFYAVYCVEYTRWYIFPTPKHRKADRIRFTPGGKYKKYIERWDLLKNS